MASPEQAAADGFAIADTMYADGVEALEQNDFVEASDFLAQCLQFHAGRSGDTSVDAALVGLKYAEALLGCARIKGSSILSGLGKNKVKDPNGASTSAGTSEAPQPDDAAEDETGGDEDLEIAWEVAETSRIGMTNNLDSSRVTKDDLTELYQTLGDICAERELFPEALIDYEEALKRVKELDELDPRWEAELHFKVSNTMEILDRGPEAQQHIQSAIKLMSKLIKEKKAELVELKKATPATEKDENPAAKQASDAEPAAAAAAESNTAAAPDTTPAEAAAPQAATEVMPSTEEAAAASNDVEKGEEEDEVDEKTALEDEIKDLEGVLEELQERSKDLIMQKQQEAAIKEQLKATLGLGAAQPGGAGSSQGAGGTSGSAGISFGGSTLENGAKPAEGGSKAAAAAQDGVQDLGVISSKRKRDAAATGSAPEGKSGKASKPDPSESEVENVEVAAAGTTA